MALPRRASLWLPVVAWAALIFVASSVSGASTGLGVWDEVLRSLAHFGEYAVLGILLTRAVPAAAAVPLGVLYAVSDEVHQSFVPGRAATVTDVAIDAAGVLAGVLAWRRWARR